MDAQTGHQARIAYIDGLRAVAVLLVVMHHAMLHSPALPRPVPFQSLAHVMLDGAHGVDLFFVLSGFCLSFPVLRSLRETGDAQLNWTAFFSRRIVRIVPPYYAAIAVFVILSPAAVPAADILKQLLFFDWHTRFINGSFWTLCVEFRWYVIFPAILALWIRAPRIFTALALFTVLAYGFTRLHAPDVGTLLPFMLGVVAADMEARGTRIDPLVWGLIPITVLSALVLEQSASMPSPYGAESSLFFVQTNAGWQLTAFLVVIAGARVNALRRLLSLRPLVAIGTASYSIYLVHEPVVAFVQRHLSAPPSIAMAAAYAIAIAAGMLFWAVIERWWMAGPLKQRAIARVEPAVAAVARALDVPPVVAFSEVRAPLRDLG